MLCVCLCVCVDVRLDSAWTVARILLIFGVQEFSPHRSMKGGEGGYDAGWPLVVKRSYKVLWKLVTFTKAEVVETNTQTDSKVNS
jgi:hypothetical protein